MAWRKIKIEHQKSRVDDFLSMSMGLGSQQAGFSSSSREILMRTDTALKLAKEKDRNRLEVLEA